MKKLISILMIFSTLFCCSVMSCSFAAEEVTQETVITKQEEKKSEINKNVILGGLGAVCVGLGACIFGILKKVGKIAKEVDDFAKKVNSSAEEVHVLYEIVTTPRVPEKTWSEKTWKERIDTILNDPTAIMIRNMIIQMLIMKAIRAYNSSSAAPSGE